MATVSHRDSKGMYSWWWNSHISPKNSKWLQENLTGMDSKVKQMIKLIEEDADSFARRAEMYYKKRPELMKLVEEFYRAYRALAERYDNATGVIRQAHRTMAEAFPNQVPLVLGDDSLAGAGAGADAESEPHTPEMSPSMRGPYDPNDLKHDASPFHAIKRNGAFTEESDSVTSRKGLKQLNDLFGSGEVGRIAKFGEGRARKGLNFHDAEKNERSGENSGNNGIKGRALSESEQADKTETEILTLKKTLAKLEAEKESDLLRYQQSLERLSNLESELSHAKEDSQKLSERAIKPEAEVQALNEALAKFQAEKESSLLQYKKCLEKISDLESNISRVESNAGELNEQASKAKVEADVLKKDLARVEAEKEVVFVQYGQCLETISNLEDKLVRAKEDARKIDERANKAETEVEILKQALTKLTDENEATAVQYQQCLETIRAQEQKIIGAQEEAQRFNSEIENGVEKLKYAEERCLVLENSNQTIHTELGSIMQKMGMQSQELTEKQMELGRLLTCIQEEHLRYLEAEMAFQTLQHLHSQTQDELSSLGAELQNRVQVLKDMEIHNQVLVAEVQKFKEENKGLNELNLSSALSMKNLHNEILNYRETVKKLEVEVGLRVDQRNALQQEIYCLKEELNDLNKKHLVMLEQVSAVGLNPEFLASSVKQLQDKNSKLNDLCERGKSERVVLLKKLEIMETLLQKNALLEKSVSDLNVELEWVRGKVKALEESCQSLLGEKSTLLADKSTLVSQLQITTDNMERILEKSKVLENSLSDANAELEGLRVKLKCLEDSCLLLSNEKSDIITEREQLDSQLVVTRQRLENQEKMYTELEEKHAGLEKERAFTLSELGKLRVSLAAEKLEHSNFAQLSETRLAGMESEICLLQEEGQCLKKEYEDQIDKAVSAQIEISIWQKCLQDSEKKNLSLLVECEQLLEASKFSEKLISKLGHKNLVQQVEVRSLCDQIKVLRMGIYQVSEILDINADHETEDKIGQDRTILNHILGKLEATLKTLYETCDENQQLVVEKSVLLTLLEQLRLEAANLATEKSTLHQEFGISAGRLVVLESELQNLKQMNEELRLQVMEGHKKEDVLTIELENLQGKLLSLHWDYQKLQEEDSEVCEENLSLRKEVVSLTEERCTLQEENYFLIGDTIYLDNLSGILKDIVSQKTVELKELSKNRDSLHYMNDELDQKLKTTEGKLKTIQVENSHLMESLEKTENELKLAGFVGEQLTNEIANGKDLLCQRENELLEAQLKCGALQNEKTELCKIVDDLRREYEEAKTLQEDQERKILKLAEDNDHQIKENRCLLEENQTLDAEVSKLRSDHEEAKFREERLGYELLKGRNEVELWESQAAAFFGELQMSAVCDTLFKEKIHELTEAYQYLEDKTISKGIETDYLKVRLSTLEGENGGLKAQLAAYYPDIISLRECVSSLEKHTLLHSEFPRVENAESKDPTLVMNLHTESFLQTNADQVDVVPDEISNLHDLQTRIRAVEKAMMEMERLAALDRLNASAKLEAAMRQIEELKSGSSSSRRIVQTRNQVPQKEEEEELGNDLNMRKSISRNSKGWNEVLTKDIMLDHISECSSYGRSRRVDTDQMLELWESTDRNRSIDLKVGKTQKMEAVPTDYRQIEELKEHKSRYSSIGSLVEKELGIDKLEISKRFRESHQEGNKKKILERLDSDVQKLTNLQITVEDLKRKVEITEKSKKGIAIEYEIVKGQLEEAEEAIMKSFDVNRKLTKTIEDGSFSPDRRSSLEPSGSGSARRRRVSEQARRGSEKIGRLQMEIQKIQFLLLKLDDEKDNKGKTKITETKNRVLLRDYIYGGTRIRQKKKKAPFCACVQPPTRED